LRFVLHAFGNHFEIQTSCHADDGSGNGRIIRIQRDIPQNERSTFNLLTGNRFR